MNDLTHNAFGGRAPATMTTREIADFAGKEHRHVLRDAEVMLNALELPVEGYAQNWTHPQNGQNYRELALPKDLTITLVSGYDVKTRHKIVVRWQNLEARVSVMALPQDFASALRALADESEKCAALGAKVEADAPKVAFAEQITVAPDAVTLGQAAKVFDTGRNRFCQRLREIGWLTRTNEPYQDKINSGYLDVKISNWDHPEKGLQRAVTALVTGKGLAKLHQVIGAAAH